MKTIWRKDLPLGNWDVEIMLPKDAEVLTVQTRGIDKADIWFICDTEAELEVRKFKIVYTGAFFNDITGTYIGTFQLNGGCVVLHLFEV